MNRITKVFIAIALITNAYILFNPYWNCIIVRENKVMRDPWEGYPISNSPSNRYPMEVDYGRTFLRLISINLNFLAVALIFSCFKGIKPFRKKTNGTPQKPASDAAS